MKVIDPATRAGVRAHAPRVGLAELRKSQPASPSPEEGRRLVVAFMGIKNAAVREAMIDLIESMSRSYDDLG